ncbi:phage protease [Nitrosomonas sp. Is37]|uniref:phage protease n=1 Tax=Nitrosomonas sp. Is37 TaxID=3080535 RepID=UPI00294B1E66|nr:phage protease [Nitrosomonas sp. Is37]MDV6343266.1 phage protease [Nitrosomonas sp. Is37]
MNRKQSKQDHHSFGLAACVISVTPNREIQLFPLGEFRAIDGRPKDVPHWYIDVALTANLIAEFESRVNRTVVDYERQTLLSAQNGQPTLAAGWFGKLEWRESGLFAIDEKWTERASQMIEAGEYRYISLFLFITKDRAVTRLLHAALINNPALDGVDGGRSS